MPKVWIADDDDAIRMILDEHLKSEGLDVSSFSDGELLLNELDKDVPDLVISDIKMPGVNGYDLLKHLNNNYEDVPVIIMTAFTDMQAAVDAYGGGAFEYLPKPFDLEEASSIVKRALEKTDTEKPKKITKTEIIGSAPSMQNVFRSIGKLSNTTATVLIQGESGTGKELIAKSLHKNSPRNDMPFIALNMADIPKELIESELFGHLKGSFTSAVKDREGKFEAANNGTIFLDEIGDMSLAAQAKVLRALEENKIQRVGSQKDISVDVRVLAATNKDLKKEIDDGNFREDLYHRLAVIVIKVPELSKRKSDIPILVDHFSNIISKEQGIETKKFSKDSLKLLEDYNWSGNVRELRNVVERLIILGGETISEDDVSLFATKK